MLLPLILVATLISSTADQLAQLFAARGYDTNKIQLPAPGTSFPAERLRDVTFKQVAALEEFPEGPSYRPADDSYFFSGSIALQRVAPDGTVVQILERPGGGGTWCLPDGSVLVIGHVGLRRIYPNGRVTLLADGKDCGRANDLTMGKHAEIYFSVPGRGIFRLTAGKTGRLEQVSDQGPNGLDVDPSGDWLYVAAGGIKRHRIHGIDQPLGEREHVCDLPKGEAGGDGCAFDAWGIFYTVHFKTGKIRVIDPHRKQLIATIQSSVVPASNLTFGGPGNSDLLVTAGTPKMNNCQVIKANLGIAEFPGHVGATEYPEIRDLDTTATFPPLGETQHE